MTRSTDPRGAGRERPGVHPAVWLVLALALALRLWGIRYGLPWLFYFHDEPQVVLRALRFGTGDLNPHYFTWPATLLLYLAFASYAALFLVGRAAGWWAGREGFAGAYFQDPSPFYLLARGFSVVFGVWATWIAWSLGAAAYSAPVGIAAALGVAVNALHAHYSHFAHPVTGMTTLTWLGLALAVRAAGGSRRALFAAGAAMGVGISIQYQAALLILPIGVAALLGARARSEGAGRAVRDGVLAVALGVGVFLAISPYVVLDSKTFRADLAWISAKASGRASGIVPTPLEGLRLFWGLCLEPALGVPLAVVAGAGAVLAIVRRTRADLVLLTYAIVYLAVASRAGEFNDRYAIPLVLPGLLFAGRAIEAALDRIGPSLARRSWAVPATVAVLCLPTAIRLVETDWTMTREDTRIAALRWFEAHVPENDRVVIDMLRFWNSMSPPLAENRERLEERLAEIRRGVAGGGAGAVYGEYYRYRLEHPRRPGYYLRSTEMGTAVRPLAELRAEGYRWAVVSDQAVRQQQARAARGDSSGLRYYQALARDTRLAAEFSPRPWVRRGPHISIYELSAPPEVRGRSAR